MNLQHTKENSSEVWKNIYNSHLTHCSWKWLVNAFGSPLSRIHSNDKKIALIFAIGIISQSGIRRNLTISLEVFHHVYFHNGFVLSGSSLCDGPIHRPEQSYRLWCVKLCDLEPSPARRPRAEKGCCATRKKS